MQDRIKGLGQALGQIGVFGGEAHERTKAVKQYVEELTVKGDVDVLIFDPRTHYAKYDVEEDCILKWNRNILYEVPKNVPTYTWSAIFSEILCETFGLGQRAWFILNKAISDVLGKAPKERSFFVALAAQINRQLDDEMNDRGGRMPFSEQETYAVLLDFLDVWNRNLNHPMNTFEFCLKPAINPAPRQHVCHLFSFDAKGKHLAMKYSMAHEFYTRMYQEEQKKPLVMVIEQAHLLFPKECKKDVLHTNESFIEAFIRESRNHNVYYVLTAEREEDLPLFVTINMAKKLFLEEASPAMKV